MRVRVVAWALVVCGAALMAGCPLGFDFGLGTGSDLGNQLGKGLGTASNVISDGSYQGKFNATAEFWYGSNLYQQDSGDGDTYADFFDGALLADSGTALQNGDIEDANVDGVSMSCQVYDIQIGEWSYSVSYDVTGQWGSIALSGTEHLTYTENSDGTITMYDTYDLASPDGAWTFQADGAATLYYSSGSGTVGSSQGSGSSSGSSGDILDRKSGKIRH